jgi:hypothetical protein
LVTSDVYTIIYCRHDKLHELIFWEDWIPTRLGRVFGRYLGIV